MPLDDRPCNRVFPEQLAPVVGWEVMLPPRESLGWFTEPGDCEAVAVWLRECPTERVVVSIDMLCYGGLVASRSPSVGVESAVRRLRVLRSLRRERPEVVIFAFSVIMRLGTTVASAGDLEAHLLLREYSQLIDRVERLGEQRAGRELEAVGERLDPAVLASYLEVRRRNHAVNREAIQLVADGVVDYLILAQEDAAPIGIHMPEQLALRDQAEEFRVGDRVSVQPGGDEVGLLLMARHCAAAWDRSPRIAADYATEAGGDVVPQFENQPLRQTVESQIAAAGGRPCAPGKADAVLFAHTPCSDQSDIAEGAGEEEAPGLALQAESVAERVQAAGAAERLVGLADTAYCNGADPALVAALRRTGAGRHLDAFAGWNTAANTTGTVVSQLCLAAGAGRAGAAAGREASRRFLACRLIDDYGYQSGVRRRAIEHAKEMGADPHALGDAGPELEKYVSAELEPLAHSIYSDLLAGQEGELLGELRFSLPWRRLFEVGVELTGKEGSKNRR